MTEQTQNTSDVQEPIKAVTAYAAASIVNRLLADDGIEDGKGGTKEIKPQMLYGYVRKGTIESVEIGGRNLIPLSVLATWYEKFRDGQLSRGGGVSVQDLTEDVRNLLTK